MKHVGKTNRHVKSIETCGSSQTTHGKNRSKHRKHGIKHKA